MEKVGAEKIVWLSEDATAISPKVNYDLVTDTIVGLVSPLDDETGCPIPEFYKASTAQEILEHVTKEKATSVYVVMAQPLDERLPAFVLQLFGSNSSFTDKLVIKRWKYVETELEKVGIKIAGISSDGDTRLMSAMSHHLLFDPTSQFICTQDHIHIACKLRNRLLNVNELIMGKFKVSKEHLKKLLNNVPKTIHKLCQHDVTPKDRQNFSSFEKVTSEKVLNALKTYVPESNATVTYLELSSDAIKSYRALDLEPCERIESIWWVTFFLRIWRESIRTHKKHTLANKFITSNAFKCIELNARNLLTLIRKCRDENRPHQFLPTLCQSQTCEHFFRQLRSMGTTNFTKINFSVLELLYMVGRIEVQNEILHFKLNNKDIIFPKFEVDTRKTVSYDLPTEIKINEAMNRAKLRAIKKAEELGMSVDETMVSDYTFPYKRHIDLDIDLIDPTETESIFDFTDVESDLEDNFFESDFEFFTDNDEDNDDESNKKEMYGHEMNNDDDISEHETNPNEIDELELNENEIHERPESSETNTNNVKKQFVDLIYDDDSKTKKVTLRKSHLVWMLTEKGTKISNDRLKRVQLSKSDHPLKRTRQMSSERAQEAVNAPNINNLSAN